MITIWKNFVYAIFYTISLLPLRVLYCIADIEFLVVYHVLHYRRKVVRNNLATAFPEKSEKERKTIERRFYRWFCDYSLESVKLLSISEKQLRKRFTIINSEEVEQCFQEGQSCGGILGHYCNWEWLSCVGIKLPPERVTGLIYKHLSSDTMDYVFYKLRSHNGGTPISRKEILRYLIKFKKEERMSIFGYIADQGPRYDNIHLWLNFLNHETGVFTGAERIMRKMNNAVFFVEMKRPRRGYYTCTFRLITRDPQSMEENEITRRFFQMLEQLIREQPEYYLWSHNRWKRSHEEFDRRYEIVNGHTILKTERQDS